MLYLGHNLPYPPHEGALIRSYHTLRLLSGFADVSAIMFYRRVAIPDREARDRAVNSLSAFGEIEAFPIMQEHSRARWLWDHVRSIASRTAYTRWAHESRFARRKLEDWLGRRSFDLVHVDSLDLMAYLPTLSELPVVLAHHNVESALLARRAQAMSGVVRKYVELQARLVREAEREWCARVDLNVAVSRADQAALMELAPGAESIVIPNGVDTRAFRPDPAGCDSDGIVFVGGYSWFPNADGMRYFAEETLPRIRRALPDVSVRWVGKAPDRAVREFADLGVEMLGYVEDIQPEVHRAKCAIVPLRVGGGTRLKILDAWAMGKAVVSTSLGCEGLDANHEENMLIADDAETFAEQVLRVFRDDELRRRLEEGGRRTAEEQYDWAVLGEKMRRAYGRLL